jgi:hypothetical protein
MCLDAWTQRSTEKGESDVVFDSGIVMGIYIQFRNIMSCVIEEWGCSLTSAQIVSSRTSELGIDLVLADFALSFQRGR